MTKTLFACALAVTATGCMPSQQYVKVAPYARTFEPAPAVSSISVVLEEIPDSLLVKGAGIKDMDVSEFRRTLGDCLSAVLSKNFGAPQTAEQVQKQGTELVVHRVSAEWDKAATIEGPNYKNYEVRVAFRWDVTLYLDGRKLWAGEGRSVSQQSSSNIFAISEVYADGVKVLCEDINKAAFTDPVQQRLAAPATAPEQTTPTSL